MRRGSVGRRTPRTYLAALRGRPGSRLTVASLVLLGAVVVHDGTWVRLVVTVAIALPVGFAFGYRNHLRTGEV